MMCFLRTVFWTHLGARSTGSALASFLLLGLLEGLLDPGMDPFLVSGLGAAWGLPWGQGQRWKGERCSGGRLSGREVGAVVHLESRNPARLPEAGSGLEQTPRPPLTPCSLSCRCWQEQLTVTFRRQHFLR